MFCLHDTFGLSFGVAAAIMDLKITFPALDFNMKYNLNVNMEIWAASGRIHSVLFLLPPPESSWGKTCIFPSPAAFPLVSCQLMTLSL